MTIYKWAKNPFLFFLPFLVIYISITLLFPTQGIYGDETNYLGYADNILQGFYSPPAPNIHLQNGPGYPVILVAFLALNIPIVFIALINSFIFYLSVVYLFKSLLKVTSIKLAVIFSIFWGLYYNLYNFIPHVLPEIFTVFLISILTINIINAFEINNLNFSIKPIIFSGFIIGYLALTKPIFGYVIVFLIMVVIILLVINKKSLNYKKSFFILITALLITTPYLTYTYQLTGRMFYWSSIGGNNLYWMSSPYKMENGSWINYSLRGEQKINKINESDKIIEELHKKDMDEIFSYEGVERDDMYRKIAVRNIKSHPIKFIENCFSNIGRIIFNFPYSYELQKPSTLLRLPHNGIIMVFALFFLIPTLINWRKISFSIRALLFFAMVYLGGSIFGSAEIRMFSMVVPILLVWIAYIFERSIKVKFLWKKNEIHKDV